MTDFLLIFHLFIKQYYGKYKRKDFIQTIIGLGILVLFEIGLIKQAHLNESILLKGYIVGALLFINVYITSLSVNTQWKEKFMDVICIMPIRPRVFWTSQILFLYIDMCLRRTLFFIILPIVLFVDHHLSANDLLVWLCKFLFLTIYSIVIGIALGNLLNRKQTLYMFSHIAALLLVFCSMYRLPILYILVCIIHIGWVIVVDFPKFLQVSNQSDKNSKSRHIEFSFYKREWNRFLSSKAMILNYAVMVAFIVFFSYNLMKLKMVGSATVFFIAVALLLTCSPIALLYSIEKHNRKLLLALPIKKWSLFWQKYAFYIGLLLTG
ncbi:bacteriocin biosynthesis protein AlbD, partial [Bacillus smithii]|uniref:bacteriocin biosynthesis protein AlbD n=2 Tax=Bacillaceae TaxID=186817 RepID=UPI003D22E654